MATQPTIAGCTSTEGKTSVPTNSPLDAQSSPYRDQEYREIIFTKLGLALTLVASFFVLREIYVLLRTGFQASNYFFVAEQVAFLAIVASLIYGNVLYQLTRIGHLRRLIKHQPASVDRLDVLYDRPPHPLTILIPSYKEEPRVVKQTILSSALQSYPRRHVVLLIDDPPPSSTGDLNSLIGTRRLPGEISSLLRPLAEHFRTELARFESRSATTQLDFARESHLLSAHYRPVCDWFRKQAELWEIVDHTDRLFVDLTFGVRMREFERRITKLEKAIEQGLYLSQKELRREYRRLAALFDVDVSGFERKLYENMSHEPNKAMNLNSYISVMGKSLLKRSGRHGTVRLEPSKTRDAEHFPDADYLINLDADSLLHPDYALRLVDFMEQPEHSRVAVVQTPYSAVPNCSSIIERIAGATTDIQYLIHQGFTSYDATYWVGANALIRKRALEDIAEVDEERSFPICRYIQDRTVIEDTESSVDLILKGWRLHNYPERLSYSATPPDFGSLIIQRQRWSNGGLIILPKLLKYLGQGRPGWQKSKEAFMRFHYLTSVAAVNFSVLALLLYPFESNLRSMWLPLTAIPYYFFYGRDLRLIGYSLKDLFRVYVLNLFLIPVNLSGVLKSIYQAVSGRKMPFRRTPKVMGKTLTPKSYVIFEAAIFCYALINVFVDLNRGHWLHAVFSLGTGLFFFYAISLFIGSKELRLVLFASAGQIALPATVSTSRDACAHSRR